MRDDEWRIAKLGAQSFLLRILVVVIENDRRNATALRYRPARRQLLASRASDIKTQDDLARLAKSDPARYAVPESELASLIRHNVDNFHQAAGVGLRCAWREKWTPIASRGEAINGGLTR